VSALRQRSFRVILRAPRRRWNSGSATASGLQVACRQLALGVAVDGAAGGRPAWPCRRLRTILPRFRVSAASGVCGLPVSTSRVRCPRVPTVEVRAARRPVPEPEQVSAEPDTAAVSAVRPGLRPGAGRTAAIRRGHGRRMRYRRRRQHLDAGGRPDQGVRRTACCRSQRTLRPCPRWFRNCGRPDVQVRLGCPAAPEEGRRRRTSEPARRYPLLLLVARFGVAVVQRRLGPSSGSRPSWARTASPPVATRPARPASAGPGASPAGRRRRPTPPG
jgi:hypothetical protein